MKIDFVSDVSCPWCIIGLKSLQQALARMPELPVNLHFQPFELNPQMEPEGEEIEAHLTRKYGSTLQQRTQIREAIRQRGEALGFTFTTGARDRIYNTFDAHRLLHWAGELDPAKQLALKLALFGAYFTEGKNPGDHALLLERAVAVGLPEDEARALLASDRYAAEVRETESFYQRAGIHSVPAVIINDQHLISGGQPPEVFEQALRQIAAAAA
ncbi:DsbA family oxidoreductase [Roseateles violae]|uniref:DsbA family oxidoreductase n=1 Tax=Roseateles violae TaxID=3058042 RepID=A0ABT8DU20_9BURK|nr:DsbA family oxidoreductase [Pelomonas sp. PFR6]MDN3920520.1 DsbA family oxidoreductase [Pelomonas sp. PFR6]